MVNRMPEMWLAWVIVNFRFTPTSLSPAGPQAGGLEQPHPGKPGRLRKELAQTLKVPFLPPFLKWSEIQSNEIVPELDILINISIGRNPPPILVMLWLKKKNLSKK